jgi:hypothetical protein
MEKQYFTEKKIRKDNKKQQKRNTSAEEVIFIFEKILEGWKTIKIYNTIIQNNYNSTILKKNVENISTGNTKLLKSELSEERYNYYVQLREKVYQYHIDRKELKKNNTMNLSKQSGDKELFSGVSMKENTMNLSQQSGDKELFSGVSTKENTMNLSQQSGDYS